MASGGAFYEHAGMTGLAVLSDDAGLSADAKAGSGLM